MSKGLANRAFWVFCQWLNIQRPTITFKWITLSDTIRFRTICLGNVMQRSRRLFGHAYINKVRVLHTTETWERVIDDWELDDEGYLGGAYKRDKCTWCKGKKWIEQNIAEQENLHWMDDCYSYDYLCELKDRYQRNYVNKDHLCNCRFLCDYGVWAHSVEQKLHERGFHWEWRDGELVFLGEVSDSDGYELDYAEELALEYWGE